MDCKINETKNMNKFFLTLLLSIACLNLQAQDGYIKFIKDAELQGKKFFKGEIYPLITSKDANFPFHFSVGTETFGVGNSVDKLQAKPDDKTPSKNDFIKLKEGGFIHIDVSSLSTGGDTIRFISEKFEVTPIIKNTSIDLQVTKVGNTFRLIIPNSPTIYYSLNELTKFAEQPPTVETDKDSDGVIDEKDNCPDEFGTPENNGCPKEGLAWWYYVLIILATGGIGFGVWRFIVGRKKRNLNTEIFYKSSLKEFALEYGGVKRLSELNPKLIPANWDQLPKSDRELIIKKLHGKRLIIRDESKRSFGFQDNKNSYNDDPMEKEWESPKETLVQPTNFGNNTELSNQLRQMESLLIREIQRISSANSNQNEINRLRNEKTELENKLKGIENKNRDSDLKQMQLQADKSSLETNLQNANDEKSRVQNEIKELKERVIEINFLKGYSESVFSYLTYCQQVTNDAISVFNKISQQSPSQSFAAGLLLINFHSAVNSIPVGDWLRTVQDIKDSGATTNRQLIRSFAQPQNEIDKQKEFQRLLFSEVLTKYSSNILILAEAFKNLSRFQDSADFANQTQSTFGKHVTEIVSKAKLTGLDIKYVPLFESWEKYLGQVEDNGRERSLPYKEIVGLEKGAIAEIVSYGVKTSVGDDTKTLIILA